MTSLRPLLPERPATFRALAPLASLSLLGGVAAASLLGCGEDPPPPAPPPRVVIEEPPPPPEPTVTSIAELKERLGISDKVELSEDDAPDTDEARIAVLKFYDAFAKGDAAAARALLDPVEAPVLDAMVADGSWKAATDDLDAIEVKTGVSPAQEPCALGLFAFVEGDDEAALWTYTASGSSAGFTAVMTPPDVMTKLDMADPIASWYSLIEQFIARAEEPDVKIELTSEDLTVAGRPADSDDGGSEDSGAPMGAPPMRRPPVDTPINPGRGPGAPTGN